MLLGPKFGPGRWNKQGRGQKIDYRMGKQAVKWEIFPVSLGRFPVAEDVQYRWAKPALIKCAGLFNIRAYAAAFLTGPDEARRNSFAGLVTFFRRFFE